MENILSYIGIFIVILSFINLIRMVVLLIGSDLYNIIMHRKLKHLDKSFIIYPTISVIIPAYNESMTILKTISSIVENGYPQNKLEIIVIDDGSTDPTAKIVQEYKDNHNTVNIIIVSKPNSGKANALNTGIRDYARGDLVMCLDADSFLTKEALKKAAVHFLDPNVYALASNVKIKEGKGLLNLLQRFEYTVCYQMKRGQTIYNIEYIIGGIGSTFRKNFLTLINYYDNNTVTEDIDLTMKMLQYGNKAIKVIYAADVVAYTQSVLSISELIRQRFRWKWGRYQTFWKNRSMFFSTEKKFTKGLTWIYLPYAIFGDFAFFFEPLVIGYIIYLAAAYHDFLTLLSAVIVISFYITMNILAEDTINYQNKIKMILLAPFMYFLFYILSYVEYIALLKSLIKIHSLKKSITSTKHVWKPVKRVEYRVQLPAFHY